MLWLVKPIDYRKGFSLTGSIDWTDVASMFFVLTILQIWCFYFQIERAYFARRKVLFVECLDQEAEISRIEAKENLKMVLEHHLKIKTDNSLFEKVYYQKAEEDFI